MQVEQVYHDVKVLLHLTHRDIGNLMECSKDIRNHVDPVSESVVISSFRDHPFPSFAGTMRRFIDGLGDGTQICGYDDLFVLHTLAKNPKIDPELKPQIENLWNAFEHHRKLLETFRYETKV